MSPDVMPRPAQPRAPADLSPSSRTGAARTVLDLAAPVPEIPPDRANMIRVEGGTFRMGSDQHYPEEAPAHRVTVDGFWADRLPVTNAEFQRFVEETGHVTFAEIAPKPEDYPGA